MSNRTDWETLAKELASYATRSLCGDEIIAPAWLPPSAGSPFVRRLIAELHNAFVAGQESRDGEGQP